MENPPTAVTVYKFSKRGTVENQNAGRSGHHRTSRTEENINRVRLTLEENPRLSARRNTLGLPKFVFNEITRLDLNYHPYQNFVRHQLQDCLHSVWSKCRIFDEEPNTKLCANLIRKTAQTRLREEEHLDLRQAADSMAHTLSTVEKEYFLRNYEKGSSTETAAISQVFHTPTKKEKKWTLGKILKLETV